MSLKEKKSNVIGEMQQPKKSACSTIKKSHISRHGFTTFIYLF